jgi:hypothetical protein
MSEKKDKDGKPLLEAARKEAEDFLKFAHSTNMPPAQVNATLQWLVAENQRQTEADRAALLAQVTAEGFADAYFVDN